LNSAKELASLLIGAAGSDSRFLVAVAGPPGAGKSTLAKALTDRLKQAGEQAVLMPMDGFHLDNKVLKERGLLARKGAPETFDAAGLVATIKRLAEPGSHLNIPIFDRARDKVVADGRRVAADDRFIVVEGNYLLLDTEPWKQMHACWNLTIFVNPGLDVLEKRLIGRWLDYGHNRKLAEQRARGNDLANARLVLENSSLPTLDIGDSK
jgi:pantothenate kinase